ncbi:hypothetical protein CYFUS_002238 [Cystobacter fuscus]|uniref:Uncharacterized protein n=1 Tax=Cystobacter fuscus TaxID=43 RepID=A0A250IZU5_9BACT|nr:hypothetical protein CYFUS_002238 [Cystobacter fuscus]
MDAMASMSPASATGQHCERRERSVDILDRLKQGNKVLTGCWSDDRGLGPVGNRGPALNTRRATVAPAPGPAASTRTSGTPAARLATRDTGIPTWTPSRADLATTARGRRGGLVRRSVPRRRGLSREVHIRLRRGRRGGGLRWLTLRGHHVRAHLRRPLLLLARDGSRRFRSRGGLYLHHGGGRGRVRRSPGTRGRAHRAGTDQHQTQQHGTTTTTRGFLGGHAPSLTRHETGPHTTPFLLSWY